MTFEIAEVLDLDAVLDGIRDAVQALPSPPWYLQHDHPKTEGPVDRAAVLRAIEEARS